MTDEFDLTQFEHSEQVRTRAQAFLSSLGISERDYTQVLEDSIQHALAFPAPVIADPRWVTIGPRNIGGRIIALAQDPSDALTLYAGSAHGGLWRTIDGGDTWEHLGLDEHNFPVGAIAIPVQ